MGAWVSTSFLKQCTRFHGISDYEAFMKTILQHGIIEKSMKTAHQPDCTQLDFNLYLDFPCQHNILGQEFTNQMWNHIFLLVLLGFILAV